MSLFGLIPEFPLLRRELTELAQRKRTYALRCVGAVVLLAIAVYVYSLASAGAVAYSRNFSQTFGRNPRLALLQFGIGGAVFDRMMPFLFWTVDLLMPALCCAAITSEKEKNTLGNLFLTRLSPTMLFAEKLFSRLVPMLTLLFLTFPILAFVYSLGGVDTMFLVSSLFLLLCECLLFASIGMMCSAWFPTTVSAFVWSYVIVGLMLVLSQSAGIGLATPRDVWTASQNENFLSVNFPGTAAPWSLTSTYIAGVDVAALVTTLKSTLPALVVTAICLLMGRWFLVRRAFSSSASLLLKVFKSVDTFFVRLNDATTSGIEIIPDRNVLPAFDPVAWRERTKKSLGKARYLFRILVVMEGPTLLICVLAAQASTDTAFSGLRSLLAILWVMTAIIVCVKGAILISSEYARETIAPLLSTPMTSAQILQQKIVGMRRLLLVLSVPILSVNATMLLLHVDVSGGVRLGVGSVAGRVLGYGIPSLLTVWLVMHILAWMSALVGMKFRRQTRSILAAILCGTGLFIVPLFADYILNAVWFFGLRGSPQPAIACLSPATLIASVEMWLVEVSPYSQSWRMRPRGSSLFAFDTTLSTVATLLVVQSLLLCGLRLVALRLAPKLLGRRDQQEVPIPKPGTAADAQFATLGP
jgi:ABC-type transport system involved in multi-copper enzyme maturation permease subunit